MKIVKIDCSKITGWKIFHQVFKDRFGFPDFYGENMNAWIDCMSNLDEDTGMTNIRLEKGQILTLQLDNVKEFSKEFPELYAAIIECSSFVNYRRIEQGDNPILALSFFN
jgi:RNAse (barnase) inhibitor barstar